MGKLQKGKYFQLVIKKCPFYLNTSFLMT